MYSVASPRCCSVDQRVLGLSGQHSSGQIYCQPVVIECPCVLALSAPAPYRNVVAVVGVHPELRILSLVHVTQRLPVTQGPPVSCARGHQDRRVIPAQQVHLRHQNLDVGYEVPTRAEDSDLRRASAPQRVADVYPPRGRLAHSSPRFAHSSPRLRPRASVAARSAALAPVYLSSMPRVVHPATLIKPCSEPPARSQRVAAVWRIR